ncbi:type III pantothenate kinase [Herbaspirillum sp.]|jgi:type III pantothenate kinase|uniref:type III pantothenate kinase n=1 Tax=Herbaspirillum TaxID=963 RepID=UPI00259025CA|nr:type III pantothenate kinase [Herbaspirillum sp.]MCP3654269.1 type III pantothenate kinase [Herbaspirillum sp.]MCP3946167.1 type III pantothenate kinase [Herbaspirillum sp.]MCP4031798.1 type III pantothenate kinase [Herbaspirillum sp.]MCP4555174.1 type III pantothenate kinase [Herbaspirillum sp.]
MRLLVDAGNTRIKWAVVADADRSMAPLPRWQQQGAVERAQVERLARDWGALARQAAPEEELQICVSNVAGPALRDSLQALLHGVFGPRVIVEWFASTAERAGVRNGYRHPGQLGCDRFAAAIGARALFPDQELLVATCGTATTIDVVSADGCFEGGMILPGFGTMATSLALNTAQLPRIDGAAPPERLFADNTVEAIVAGCIAAQVGAIEHALAERRRLRPNVPLRCLLAGGAGLLLAPYLASGDTPLEKVDNLVLIGLHMATMRV